MHSTLPTLISNGSRPNPAGQGQNQSAPRFSLGGIEVRELPIAQFGGDIVFTANQAVNIDVPNRLNGNATGFLLLNVQGTVKYSVNGGAIRTAYTPLAFDGLDLRALYVETGPLSTCTVQIHGA